MTLTELNSCIKSKRLQGAYFFYGEEQYLLEEKINAIQSKIITPGTEVFNVVKFNGKKTTAAEIIAAIDQFPQMSEMKLIVVKNTGMLNNATLNDFKLIKSAVTTLPSDTCLIFTENTFDKKKLKNVKFFEDSGGIVVFDYMPINKLSVWIETLFKKQDKEILDKEIRYILLLCGQSLAKLTTECEKLINYTGDRRRITREDIDAVVDRTVEYRTYDMLDNMISGNSKKAQEQLKYLFDTREDPFYILGLMMSRLSELLMCKLLKEDGLSGEQIGEYFDFKRPAFAVNKTINESRKFSEAYLKKMIDKGLYYDIECKQGLLSPHTAAEMYLADITIS